MLNPFAAILAFVDPGLAKDANCARLTQGAAKGPAPVKAKSKTRALSLRHDRRRHVKPESVLCPSPAGLYCPPGDFHIDPVRPVARAVITHGHSDHARAGHGMVLATKETLAIMAARYGESFAATTQAVGYGEKTSRSGVEVTLVPAGHILGSAQAVVRSKGFTVVVSATTSAAGMRPARRSSRSPATSS